MTREFGLSLVAALLYALGAICMKASNGLKHGLAALALYACFGLGATFQALALQRQDVGSGNTIVLGVEAIASLLLGIAIFREAVTPAKLIAVVLVAGGVWLLRQ
jgi:quaternary ammonium compound-resistance protein SugE